MGFLRGGVVEDFRPEVALEGEDWRDNAPEAHDEENGGSVGRGVEAECEEE